MQKAFQVSQWILSFHFNSRMLALSNQWEIVSTSDLGAWIWWSKCIWSHGLMKNLLRCI